MDNCFDYDVIEYTNEEYVNDLKKDFDTLGLNKAVEKRLDEIDDYASSLGYVSHGCIQELSCEILDLINEIWRK